MKTIVQYELKKIFQNKLFIGAFVICLIAMIAMSSVAVYQYNTGTRGHFDMTLMKGEKAPEVFVSNENIDELRKAVEDFENRDDIYYESEEEQQKDYLEGGQVYWGKYDINASDLFFKLETGEITEAEFEALSSHRRRDLLVEQCFEDLYQKKTAMSS